MRSSHRLLDDVDVRALDILSDGFVSLVRTIRDDRTASDAQRTVRLTGGFNERKPPAGKLINRERKKSQAHRL
jgi:hypothetical protein